MTPRARWVLEAASDAFERLLGRDGCARCPEHGVDHTGKTARAIVINCALHAATGQDDYLDRAVRVARLITGRLGQDPEAGGAWIFFPGRHHPANNSTNIIDNGECVDALATLLRQAGEELSQADRARSEDAVRLCCDSYLVSNVRSKPVINQRLWGAMGLASAYAALGDPGWAEAAEASVAGGLAEMRDDGSFPYMTRAHDINEPAGAEDLTVHYHGKCLAFARFALERIGAVEAHRDALRRGADFLRVSLRPDAVKPLGLEGKRWFWDGDFETGAASYDAYALAADGREGLRDLVGRVAARAAASMGPDGLIDATDGQPTFVCRVFHTADLAWLARAHEAAELDDSPTGPATGEPGDPVICPDAGVVRLEALRACAILRTRKRPANGLVGGRLGGGNLVYAGRQHSLWRNQLRHVPEPGVPEATWVVGPSGSLLEVARAGVGLQDRTTRFRLHVARCHWRAGRRLYALRMLWRFLGPQAWSALRRWQSNHATEAEVEVANGGVVVHSCLARMDGTPLAGVRTERRYRVETDHLVVDDRLIADASLPEVAYRYPPATDTFEVIAGVPWWVDDALIRVGPLAAGAVVAVKYRL